MSRRVPLDRKNRVVAFTASGVFLFMLGMSFAAVPLYDMFCRATGYGGTPMVATRAPDRISEREFTIRLDSNVAPGLGWVFQPEVESLTIRAGEVKTVSYTLRNPRSSAAIGIASYNVSPDKTGAYFNKIACFCFTEQKLQPGEAAELPVLFYVDPAIAKDHSLDHIDTITLSYTFFAAEPAKAAGKVAVLPAGEAPKL